MAATSQAPPKKQLQAFDRFQILGNYGNAHNFSRNPPPPSLKLMGRIGMDWRFVSGRVFRVTRGTSSES
jgi:hypothetical protein